MFDWLGAWLLALAVFSVLIVPVVVAAVYAVALVRWLAALVRWRLRR